MTPSSPGSRPWPRRSPRRRWGRTANCANTGERAMGWRLGKYYYKCIWINGRVVNRYWGCGEMGAMYAGIDELIRRKREQERLERLAHELEQRELRQSEQARGEVIRRLVAIVLEG